MTRPPLALAQRLARLRLAAALVGALVLALAWSHLQLTRRDFETQEMDRARLHARMLESQAAGLIEAVSLSLAQVDEVMRALGDADPVLAGRFLRDATAGRPHVLSLSLLDTKGRVLASSSADNVDRTVDLAALGGWPTRPGERMGPVFVGRDLADLAARETKPAGGPAGTARSRVHGLPMMRLLTAPREPLLLVAVMNPDRFSTLFSALLTEAADDSLLMTYSGVVVAAGPDTPFAPGEQPPALQDLKQMLERAEAGSYVGSGLAGSRALVAYRSVRSAPLAVVTQIPYTTVTNATAQRYLPVGLAVALVLAAVLLVAVLAERGIRAEDRSRARILEAHAETARAQERLQLAVAGAELGVFDFDLAAGSASLSPRMLSMLGYDARSEPWAVKRYAELLHPDDVERAQHGAVRHFRGEAPAFSEEVRMRCADGSWRWVLIQGMVSLRSAEGRALRFSGTVQDIDVRKTADAALRASQARQRAILHSALDGMVITDAAGGVIDANPAAEALFGWSLAEARGKPLGELILPPEARASIRRDRTELTVRRQDGATFPAELAVVPVETGDGPILAVTIHDLTRRRRAEHALRESERRFRAAFEQAAVGMLEQAPDRRLLRVNGRFCSMLGYTAEEMLEVSMADVIHPDDVENGLKGMRAILAGELEVFREEKRYRHKDGRWIWALLTASPSRDEEGRVQSMLGVVEDISVRKRVEAELVEVRQRELAIGQRIQQELLMEAHPQPHPRVWLAACSQSSRGIDGDFLEVLRMGPDTVDIVVADVMGKGVPAALLGAATKLELTRALNALLLGRTPGSGVPEPAEIVSALEDRIGPHLLALEAFVTLAYVRVDLAARRLTWVGCGHEEPLVVTASGERRHLANQHPPVGVMPGRREQGTMDFPPGDMLFLCSDGVSDAMLPDRTRLGRQRVDAAAAARWRSFGTPTMALHGMRLDLFTPGTELTDDATLVMVSTVDSGTPARHLELDIGLDSVTPLRKFVADQLAAQPIEEATQGLFVTGAVEAFTNIVRHAQGLLPQAPVEVLTRARGGAFVLELRYVGDAFEPPQEPPESDLTQFPEGGFGLYIVKNSADHVEYRHKRGVNSVRMTLALPRVLAPELKLF